MTVELKGQDKSASGYLEQISGVSQGFHQVGRLADPVKASQGNCFCQTTIVYQGNTRGGKDIAETRRTVTMKVKPLTLSGPELKKG